MKIPDITCACRTVSLSLYTECKGEKSIRFSLVEMLTPVEVMDCLWLGGNGEREDVSFGD